MSINPKRRRALIAMAVHNTAENRRFFLTERTFKSLLYPALDHHDVYIIDNDSSCHATRIWLNNIRKRHGKKLNIIRMGENVGTAAAINEAWKFRRFGQPCVKMDNDIVSSREDYSGIFDEMIDALEREPRIGILGLKRKDCWEHPTHENPDLRSELIMLPHEPGQRWIVAEKVFHVMGTCQMYASHFLDKFGYLWQPSLYGYDDVLAAHRCHALGYWSCFLPHIEIDHIDPGDTPYQSWKERHAGEVTQQVIQIAQEYRMGIRSCYYNPFSNESA